MYAVHFRRHADSRDDFVQVGTPVQTIKEAADLRQQSGDLVVRLPYRRLVRSQEWLFPWEKEDPNCYAQRAIKNPNA